MVSFKVDVDSAHCGVFVSESLNNGLVVLVSTCCMLAVGMPDTFSKFYSQMLNLILLLTKCFKTKLKAKKKSRPCFFLFANIFSVTPRCQRCPHRDAMAYYQPFV